MCAGGALCGFSSFGLVVCALCLSVVLYRMCRAVALASGVRDLSSSSDLALCLCLVFDCLLEFLFIRFFSFSFLSCYFMWVLSMCSSRGRLRTMCGSRIGGWSLPCVMSDDNIVWTDSWLSIACAGCGLTGVGAGEEQVRKVVAG
jgi:hypothetical protein